MTARNRTDDPRYAISAAWIGRFAPAAASRIAPALGAIAGARWRAAGADAVIRTPTRARPVAGN